MIIASTVVHKPSHSLPDAKTINHQFLGLKSYAKYGNQGCLRQLLSNKAMPIMDLEVTLCCACLILPHNV